MTPGNFLSINNKNGRQDVEINYEANQDNANHLLELWKKGQNYLNKYWDSWLHEYLPSLRERYNILMKNIKGEVDRSPSIGEVVIIKEDGLPRGRWKVGKIIKLVKSEIDGLERAAKIQYPSGRISCRPVRLLFPLEYSEAKVKDVVEDIDNNVVEDNGEAKGKDVVEDKDNNVVEDNDDNGDDVNDLCNRVRRTAANKARTKIGKWCRKL